MIHPKRQQCMHGPLTSPSTLQQALRIIQETAPAVAVCQVVNHLDDIHDLHSVEG